MTGPLVTLRRVVELLEAGGPFVQGTVVAAGVGAVASAGHRFAWRDGHDLEGATGDEAIDLAVARLAGAALVNEAPSESCIASDGARLALRRRLRDHDAAPGSLEVAWLPHVPQERLAIVGAGHVAVPLCALAATVGYAVTVIDDRERFATAARFPGAHEVLVRDFGMAIDAIGITPWTSVVLVTRGHEHDERCLAQVVSSTARYVGMIGSRRRVKVVYGRLCDAGVPAGALERIHAPIGLDLGGRSPEEIALAILAEIVLARRGGTGERLSGRRNPGIRRSAGVRD